MFLLVFWVLLCVTSKSVLLSPAITYVEMEDFSMESDKCGVLLGEAFWNKACAPVNCFHSNSCGIVARYKFLDYCYVYSKMWMQMLLIPVQITLVSIIMNVFQWFNVHFGLFSLFYNSNFSTWYNFDESTYSAICFVLFFCELWRHVAWLSQMVGWSK